jgi:Cu-Zn family superoxide dismutase
MRWTTIATLALALAACGGGEAEPEPEAEPETAGAETEVEVVPPEGGEAPAAAEVTAAVAEMSPTEGNDVRGTVRFTQQAESVLVNVDLTGLEPGSVHGFHVHEHGDCSAPDASSAGGHYDPTGVEHGLPPETPRHAGDMGNIQADEQGEVHTQLEFDIFSVSREDPPPVLGRGVIVHAREDDGSQPAGNAGPRLSCGVIEGA